MTITVRKRQTSDWVAYIGEDGKIFESGKNESEAVGRLIITLGYVGIEFNGKIVVNRRFV